MARYINVDALISDVKQMRNAPNGYSDTFDKSEIIGVIEEQPTADANSLKNAIPSERKDACKGCKHMGLWENEVEYGYPSPCTRCKRRASDNYER